MLKKLQKTDKKIIIIFILLFSNNTMGVDSNMCIGPHINLESNPTILPFTIKGVY